MAGPEEVIRSEFTDSLTRDIRGASFSHAQWTPGFDSTKTPHLQGNLTRAREAGRHLSSTYAPGTITPDTAHEFTHGAAHIQYIYDIPTSMFSYVKPYTGDLHVLLHLKYTQQTQIVDMQLITQFARIQTRTLSLPAGVVLLRPLR